MIKLFLTNFLIPTAAFAAIYGLIRYPTLNGALDFSIFDNYIFAGLIVLALTVKISYHLIRIKLVLWRIFLQTFLDASSKIYKFFAHGYMVRIVATILGVGLAVKILIFFCMIPVHFSQFAILYCGFIVFVIFKVNDLYGADISFLRSDLGGILKLYLSAFLLATLTGVCVSVWEIYSIDETEAMNVLQL